MAALCCEASRPNVEVVISVGLEMIVEIVLEDNIDESSVLKVIHQFTSSRVAT